MDKTPQGSLSNSASCNGSSRTDTLEKNNSSCETRFDQKPWVGSHKPSRDTCVASRHTWCSANKHNRTTCLAHMEFEWISFWHSINSTLSHSDSQNKHSKNTTVSHTSHVAKETSESKRRCVSSETSACDQNIDWHPWLHAPHAQTPTTHAWNKQPETNAKNDTRRHAMQRQIPPRKTTVGQLRFGNKIENSILRATRAKIMIILGAFVEHHADLLGKTRYKNWRLDTHRRCRCDKRSKIRSTTRDPPRPNTGALPWTQTPNHYNFIQKLLWNSPLAIFNVRQIKSKKKRFSLNNQQRIYDLTTYHYKRAQQQTPQHSNATRQTWRQNTTKIRPFLHTNLDPSPNPQFSLQPTKVGINDWRNVWKKIRRINTRRKIVHETTSWPDRHSHPVNQEKGRRNNFSEVRKTGTLTLRTPRLWHFPTRQEIGWLTEKMEII